MKINKDNVSFSIISFVLALGIAVIYHFWAFNNISFEYNYFVYGDLIASDFNKKADLNFIYVFVFSFVLLQLIFYRFKITLENVREVISSVYMTWFARNDKLFMRVVRLLFVIFGVYFSVNLVFKLIPILESYSHYRKIFYIAFLVVLIFVGKCRVLISQISLGLAPLLYINTKYKYNSEIVSFVFPFFFQALLYFIAILSIAVSVIEYRKGNSKYFYVSSLIFVSVLFSGHLDHMYLTDEYHNGEIFTAFHQLYDIGSKAYSEYIPTKGFMHIAIGYVNQVVFNGAYLTLYPSIILSTFLFSVFLVFLLKAFYSNINVFFILLAGLPTFGYNALIIPSLLIISRVIRTGQLIPTISICSWLFFIYFLYYNAFAIVFVLSVLPALIYSIKHLKVGEIRNKFNIICLFFITLLLAVCLANHEYIYESARYVLTNASYNMLHWGNYGSRSELVKANFWFVAFSALFSIFLFDRKSFSNDKMLWLSYLLVSPLLMVSYLVSRAGGDFPRAFHYSIFYFIVILAFVIFYLKGKKRLFISTMLLISICIMNNNNVLSIRDGFRNFVTKVIPPNMVLSSDNSIPKLGEGFIEKERLNDLKSEFELVKYLNEDESFLIIDYHTVQSARYSLYDLRIPTKSHAILNVPSVRAQKIELEQVSSRNVKIVRLSEGLLRYHLFHKYLLSLQGFSAFEYNDRIYLVSEDYAERLPSSLNIKLVTNLSERLSVSDFSSLPYKWGRALSNEKNLVEMLKIPHSLHSVNNYSIQSGRILGHDPYAVFKLNDLIEGKEIDLLSVKLSDKFDELCRGQLFWSSDKDFIEAKSVRFTFSNGKNLIPIHMNSAWTSSKARFLRLDFDSCAHKSIVIDGFKFYKYR